jgi:hypothetical protein
VDNLLQADRDPLPGEAADLDRRCHVVAS